MTGAVLERTPDVVIAEPAAAPAILEWRDDERLWVCHGLHAEAVTVHRCFPWSAPARYVSLRNERGHELLLVVDPAALSTDCRRALEAALADQGFVLEVTRVLSVVDEVEIRHWTVETRHGPRALQTRLDEWPRTLASGGIVIRDVAGDLYHIADPSRLDRASRELLWAFVD